jgi:hypothetical protein
MNRQRIQQILLKKEPHKLITKKNINHIILSKWIFNKKRDTLIYEYSEYKKTNQIVFRLIRNLDVGKKMITLLKYNLHNKKFRHEGISLIKKFTI